MARMSGLEDVGLHQKIKYKLLLLTSAPSAVLRRLLKQHSVGRVAKRCRRPSQAHSHTPPVARLRHDL